jgi:hypothetical protein
MLIALVIVAFVAERALKGYGLLPGPDQATHAGTRMPPAASQADVAPTSAPATPTTAIERARGLELQVQRDAQDQAKRIDEQTQ